MRSYISQMIYNEGPKCDVCVLGRALLCGRYGRGEKGHGARLPEWNFSSGRETKKLIIGRVFCTRFLIAARKNHPNLSVYILLYYIITQYCDITIITQHYCEYYAKRMMIERWSPVRNYWDFAGGCACMPPPLVLPVQYSILLLHMIWIYCPAEYYLIS